jgi:hypothetical protein
MKLRNVFMTTTGSGSPLDGSAGDETKPPVSDFITIQSFANFATMTGGITAAWHGAQRLIPEAASILVPYVLALVWATISFFMSLDGLRETIEGKRVLKPGSVAAAAFVALVNSLVLAGAVIGTNITTGEAR